MKKLSLLGVLVASAAMSHASFTLATFADPATDGSTPMFVWDKTNGTLSGSWTSPGLSMDTPGFINGGHMDNVQMMFDPVALTSVIPNTIYTFGSGRARFYSTDINDPFLTITFDSGTFLIPSAVAASSFTSDNVAFSGPDVPGGAVDQQFSFSFANPVGSNQQQTYTSSFTSSLDVVPEPATLASLGLGLSFLGRFRRRKQGT